MSDEGQTEPAHRKPRPTVVIRCGHRGCPLKTSSACTAGRRAAVFSQDAWAFGCSLGTGTPTRLGLSTSERVIAVRRLLKRPRIGGSAEQRVLRGAAYVPVVEATELGNRYDVAGGRLHDLSRDGRIFVKREVSPGSQVVLDVVGQHATHAGCAQDDDVIEALASNRSDQSLHVRVGVSRQLHHSAAVQLTAHSNAFCERLIGTIRRECLDLMIPLNERHLRCALQQWVTHYNRGRPRASLGPGIPDRPANDLATVSCGHRIPDGCRVVAEPILGGLHHEYRLEPLAA